MKEGLHLSEALINEQQQYQKGRLNLIVAQTGQGKTTAAINTIPKQIKISFISTSFLYSKYANKIKQKIGKKKYAVP